MAWTLDVCFGKRGISLVEVSWRFVPGVFSRLVLVEDCNSPVLCSSWLRAVLLRYSIRNAFGTLSIISRTVLAQRRRELTWGAHSSTCARMGSWNHIAQKIRKTRDRGQEKVMEDDQGATRRRVVVIREEKPSRMPSCGGTKLCRPCCVAGGWGGRLRDVCGSMRVSSRGRLSVRMQMKRRSFRQRQQPPRRPGREPSRASSWG